MYTLRIIEETRENESQPFDQVIENFELGVSYSFVKKGNKEFDRMIDQYYVKEDKDAVEAIICGGNEKIFFIMKNNENRVYSYFVMGDSGKTFERLY